MTGLRHRITMRFRDDEALREQFVREISRGRMFVRSSMKIPMSAVITIALTLPDSTQIELAAEVVRRIAPDTTGDAPGDTGYAVRLLNFSADVRARFEAYLTGGSSRASSVAPPEPQVQITRELDREEVRRRTEVLKKAREDKVEGMDPEQASLAAVLNLADEIAVVEHNVAHGTAYDVLGVKPEASQATLTGVFQARMAALDPSRHPDLPVPLMERMVMARLKVNDAYNVLMDPGRRAELDVSIRNLHTGDRTAHERLALVATLERFRDEQSETMQQEYPKAVPLQKAARDALRDGLHHRALSNVRLALLYDPYSPELHELAREITERTNR